MYEKYAALLPEVVDADIPAQRSVVIVGKAAAVAFILPADNHQDCNAASG